MDDSVILLKNIWISPPHYFCKKLFLTFEYQTHYHEKDPLPYPCFGNFLPDLPVVVLGQRNNNGHRLVRCRICHIASCNILDNPQHRQPRFSENMVVYPRGCDTKAALELIYRKLPVMHDCVLGIAGPSTQVFF